MTKTFLTILAITLSAITQSAFAETLQLSVSGMTCSSCSETVTKKLKTNPSVEAVEVSLKRGTVTVSLKDGAVVSDEELKMLIADAGYTLKEVVREKA